MTFFQSNRDKVSEQSTDTNSVKIWEPVGKEEIQAVIT